MAGKSMKLGGGGRFAKLKGKLESEGKSAESAGAIAASAGRKKYGAKKMASMAHKGKIRAEHKKGGNTRIDMGEAGQSAGIPGSMSSVPMVPDEEMHSAKRSPNAMTDQDMFATADPSHHLHALIEEHSKQAAFHAGKGESHRTMREHHEGMARALRANLHPGKSESY